MTRVCKMSSERGQRGKRGGFYLRGWDRRGENRLALIATRKVVEDGKYDSWMDLAGHIARGTVDEEALRR